MRRAIAIAIILLTLDAFAPLEAAAKCRFACVAHKVTDLKRLTLALQRQLEEDEGRIDQQGAAILALRERNASLEATGASLTSAYGSLAQRFNNLSGCLGEIPLTRYGQPEGPSGYLFQISTSEETEVFPTTALDISYDNSPVGAWTLVDACNYTRVQSATTQLFGPVHPIPAQAARFGGK